MKKLILAVAIGVASIGTAQARSIAESNTQSAAQSAAMNAGNAQQIEFNSVAPDRQTVRTAPALGSQGFYGSFSSDSCMVSGGGGVSIVGIGAQMTTPIEDYNCNLRRNFERVMQASATTKDADRAHRLEVAAVDILCQAGEATRNALEGQGLCSVPKANANTQLSSLRAEELQFNKQTFAAHIEH